MHVLCVSPSLILAIRVGGCFGGVGWKAMIKVSLCASEIKKQFSYLFLLNSLYARYVLIVCMFDPL